MASNSYVTVQEFQNSRPGVLYINLPAAELQSYVNRASAWIEHYCQRIFAVQSGVIETLFSGNMGRVMIDNAGFLLVKPVRSFPINVCTTITWQLRTASLLVQTGQSTSSITTVNNNDVLIVDDTWGDGYAIRVFEDFRWFRDPSTAVQFTVTYSGGYATYPDWLQEACIRATAAALRRRGTTASAAGGSGLPLDMTGLGGDLDAARELLDVHKRRF